MNSYKILVLDPIAEKGLSSLHSQPGLEVTVKPGLKEAEIIEIAGDYDAFIVRSGVKITRPIFAVAKKLRAIGRAGVGVDNIDLEAASEHGVVVMNTPGGNTISTAEHAFTLMLSLARSIPQAHASVSSGKWERKSFAGVELYGKTLAVLGMGRIGGEFASRALAFGMRVVAYDPYLSAARAKSLRVELCENLDDAVNQADFITLHMPLTPETKHMINEQRLANMKQGVRIINCARGGLIDEAALAVAIEKGHVGGAALDVYEVEPPPADYPLLASPKMVFTPHLGASTLEAQENVGIEIAIAILNYLTKGEVANAVNMPSVDASTMQSLAPYLDFGKTLGRVLSQIAPRQVEVLRINYTGHLGELDTSLVSRSILAGYLLRAVGPEQVNLVNAIGIAQKLGLRFTTSRIPEPGEFTDLIEVIATAGNASAEVCGTLFGGRPRVVRINGNRVEAEPNGTLLMYENTDKPGMIGSIGTLLGRHDINIANMSLSRNAPRGRAVTLLTLDSTPPSSVLEEIKAVDGILSVHCVDLD